VFDSNLAPSAALTRSLPGSISGVAQVQLQLPIGLTPGGTFTVRPLVGGKVLRERLVLIWTRPQ